jgi:hypothetical protein
MFNKGRMTVNSTRKHILQKSPCCHHCIITSSVNSKTFKGRATSTVAKNVAHCCRYLEDTFMVRPRVKQAIQDFFNSLRACICSAYRGEGSDFNYVLPKEALRYCELSVSTSVFLSFAVLIVLPPLSFWFSIADY